MLLNILLSWSLAGGESACSPLWLNAWLIAYFDTIVPADFRSLWLSTISQSVSSMYMSLSVWFRTTFNQLFCQRFTFIFHSYFKPPVGYYPCHIQLNAFNSAVFFKLMCFNIFMIVLLLSLWTIVFLVCLFYHSYVVLTGQPPQTYAWMLDIKQNISI